MRTRLAAIGLIAGLLAACTSGSSDPTPTPSITPDGVASGTTTPTPSQTEPLTTGPNVRPGEKPPVFPELAKQHTADGALAFAAYYYEAFDWGYATNDPYLVQEISGTACTACRKYVGRLHALTKNGGVLRGGRITLLSRGFRHGDFNYRSDYVVEAAVNESAIVIQRAGSAPRTAAPAVSNYHQYVFISWEQGGWRVVEVAGAS